MRSLPSLALLVSSLLPLCLSASCAVPEGDYFDVSADKQDNAVGNRWQVPGDVVAIGDSQDVDYTGAGPWTGDGSCEGGMTVGAEALRDFLVSRYPQISTVGGYACRPIVGRGSETSVHATGRALDIMLPVGFRAEADNGAGDPIGNFLIANADAIGIQFIIWDRTSWGAHREVGKKERYYSGQHPHNDHLHVEISTESADGLTPWLSEKGWIPVEVDQSVPPSEPAPTDADAPPTPIDDLPPEPPEDEPEEPAPSVPPLGDPLPEAPRPSGVCAALEANGGIIDEASNCLWLRGPANYWKHESEGNDNGLAWTTPTQSGKHLSFAEWEINIAREGVYDVEVYVEPEFGNFHAARYYMTHANSTTESMLDMRSGSGWVHLGSYAFAQGGDQRLTLFDNSDGAVEEGARIVVDAIRLTAQNQEPDVPEDPELEPSDPDQPDPPSPIEPSEPSDPNPEPSDDLGGGVVTSGCQAVPASSSTTSFMLLLMATLLLGRRKRRDQQ